MATPLTRTIAVGATRVVVGPSWVVTILPSGAEVHAHPNGSERQAATARELGYGDDVAAMTRDHDPLHSALAAWAGLPASLALRAAAGELPEDLREVADLEEEAVLAVQRFLRRAGLPVPLSAARGSVSGMQPIQRDPKLRDIVSYVDPVDGARCPASVTYVHSSECVNLQFVNSGGTGCSASSVPRGGDSGKWDFVSYE